MAPKFSPWEVTECRTPQDLRIAWRELQVRRGEVAQQHRDLEALRGGNRALPVG